MVTMAGDMVRRDYPNLPDDVRKYVDEMIRINIDPLEKTINNMDGAGEEDYSKEEAL